MFAQFWWRHSVFDRGAGRFDRVTNETQVGVVGIRHIDFHPDVFARLIAAESICRTAS